MCRNYSADIAAYILYSSVFLSILPIGVVEALPICFLTASDTLYLPVDRNSGELTIPVLSDTEVIVEKANDSVEKNKLLNPQKSSGEFQMIVIGGALAAGVRNGGLYRESQLTAYPNLVANQMGIDFKQPLFESIHGNGSGYNVLIRDKKSVFKYQRITNNLAFDKNSKERNYPKYLDKVDNLALPYFGIRSGWKDFEYYSRLNLPSMESQDFIPFFKRLLSQNKSNNSKTNYYDLLKDTPVPDFTIFDLGMDIHLQSALVGGDPSQLPQPYEGEYGEEPEFSFIRNVFKKGSKGVVVTIPDVMDLPYFKLYSLERLLSICPNCKVAVDANCGPIREANLNDVLLPCEKITNLFSGKTNSEELTENEVLSVDQNCDETAGYRIVNWYNDYYVKNIAKKSDFALFDLYSLYKKINDGKYVTDDGIFVDPSFPNGNFYSDDAIYPSAFGQAVIANECIKAINQYYQTAIPLIKTELFLKK